jgi:hypothetical protein
VTAGSGETECTVEKSRPSACLVRSVHVEQINGRRFLPDGGAIACDQKRQGARRMSGTLHLAQAHSNRGRRGRKRDFADAERLLKRLVANELILSFVPDPEQRLWRTVTRAKGQQIKNRVQLQNRLEALLEEAHIKLSSLVSDLLGVSARRILKALAEGQTDPAALAALAHDRCPKGNRPMRRLLNQAANAAVQFKGSIFELLYRRYVPRLGHNQTIGLIAHRLCHLIWKILHQGVTYEERGPAVSATSHHRRTTRMIRELRKLGYRVELASSSSAVRA